MNIKCPHCGTEYEVDKDNVGMFVTCESCGKGFVVGAMSDVKSGGMPHDGQPASCRSSGIFALWVCVIVLVLNLATLFVLCHRINTEFSEMKEVVVRCASDLEKRLEQHDKSRHYDAEQIYDRMGRMKLY